MPVHRLARRPNAAKNTPPGNVVEHAVDSNDNRLYINRGNSMGREPISADGVRVVTASVTLTSADDGVTIVADSTTSVIVTLPLSTACPGAKFTLIVKQLTTTVGHSFSPAAADYITGAGLTAVVDKDLIIAAASDRVGDSVTVQSDGVNGYFIIAVVGTVAKE